MDSSRVAVWLVIGALAITLGVGGLQQAIARRRTVSVDRYRSSSSNTFVGLLVAAVLAGWISAQLDRPMLLSWLLAVNAVAVAFYGFDKLAAILALARVPERTLHLLALAGGSVGALVGQRAFRHKVSTRRFQLTYWSVVALQAALIAAYLRIGPAPT